MHQFNQEDLGTTLSCFGCEKKMAEQLAEHFTHFTMNCCLETQQEDNLTDNIWNLETRTAIYLPNMHLIEMSLTLTKVSMF